MRRLPPVSYRQTLANRSRASSALVQDVGEEGGLERFRRPMWPKATFLLGKNWFDPLEAGVRTALAQNLPLKYSFAAHVEAQPERLYFLMDPGLGHSAL